MPVIDMLEIGKQGMDANRQALQTSSNNVANANTPGYSRQRTILSTNDQPLHGDVRIPGVSIKETIRVHDHFIENQLIDEAQILGAAKARAEGLRRVESAVHNDAFRVNDLLNNFFNDFRELSANPDVTALRNNVRFSAAEAVTGFRSLSTNLISLRDDLDMQIGVAVNRVNTLAKEVADLNAKIAMFDGKGDPPLELFDRRDAAVREIADKLGLQDSAGGNKNINLSAGGVGVLVNGNRFNELVVMRTPPRDNKVAGSYDIFVRDGAGLRLATDRLKEGEIGGLLHVRDEVVNPMVKHLDRVAFEFGNSVNELHQQGVGSDGLKGRNLFDVPKTIDSASQLLQVSTDVTTNASAIAVGVTPDAPGDNRIALAIAELQNAAVLPDDPNSVTGGGMGRQTFNESLSSLVGKVAVQVQHEDHLLRHQESILNQLETYRQSVSGVNLDEEAIDMMKYQAAFNASAKAMKVGDELFQTILSLKG